MRYNRSHSRRRSTNSNNRSPRSNNRAQHTHNHPFESAFPSQSQFNFPNQGAVTVNINNNRGAQNWDRNARTNAAAASGAAGQRVTSGGADIQDNKNIALVNLAQNQAHTHNHHHQMNGGYDIQRVMDGQMHQELKDSLICGICLEIPIDPMECDNCRKLFCKDCIAKWPKSCPFQCPGQLRVRPCSHILREFIQILQITCNYCEELVLFSQIQEHEEWCKKDKCANKQCQMILEHRSRKEFKYNEKTVQVCDEVCYQMYRLQLAMKGKNNEQAIMFFQQYFNEEEESDIMNQQKEIEMEQRRRMHHNPMADSAIMDNHYYQHHLNDMARIGAQRQITGVVITNFVWDVEKAVAKMARQKVVTQEISLDRRHIFVLEEDYVFRNFFGTVGFNEGIHYWEIIADARTEHELKVGVSSLNNLEGTAEFQKQLVDLKRKADEEKKSGQYYKGLNSQRSSTNNSVISASQNSLNKSANFSTLAPAAPTSYPSHHAKEEVQLSFSDIESGWAFFGIGQLRHNSNMNGNKYGKSFKRQGTLGVFLNMNKGRLSFSLDGQYMGVAFDSPKLKEGPIYPAISLLHNAGCILVTGKPPPLFFYD